MFTVGWAAGPARPIPIRCARVDSAICIDGVSVQGIVCEKLRAVAGAGSNPDRRANNGEMLQAYEGVSEFDSVPASSVCRGLGVKRVHITCAYLYTRVGGVVECEKSCVKSVCNYCSPLYYTRVHAEVCSCMRVCVCVGGGGGGGGGQGGGRVLARVFACIYLRTHKRRAPMCKVCV